MTFLRFIRMLSLTLWIGSFFFFAAVEAPILFTVQPSHALAGLIVGHSLSKLHWIAIVCALVFLLAEALLSMLQRGSSVFPARDYLLAAMLAVTIFLQFRFEPRMIRLRDSMGVIDNVPLTDARRIAFDHMHIWSTRLESAVFFLGLLLMYLVIREQETSQRRY